jgi:hypothetical protein
MNPSVIDRLGEWNPQLFRELKGRLKPRNVSLVAIVVLGFEFLTWLFFSAQLPTPDTEYSRYCIGEGEFCTVDWLKWWFDLEQSLYWAVGLTLVVGIAYVTISDLAREERRGTLNFLRLSPQSSLSILSGKLLGVPILIYLGALLALPFHFHAASSAGMGIGAILSFYLLLAGVALLTFTVSAVFALMGGSQGWIGSGLSFGFMWILLHCDRDLINPGYAYIDDFYNLSISENLFLFRGFILANCALWSFWGWQALHRRFHNPSATIFSKKQSYLLTVCFELLLLGFSIQLLSPEWKYHYHLPEHFYLIGFLNMVWCLASIAALSPHRQTLQDWARYRYENKGVRREKGQSNFKLCRSSFDELIYGEKSPAPIAIALNLAIASLIFLPWLMSWPEAVAEEKMIALWSSLFGIGFLVICAIVAQLLLLMKHQKRAFWAMGTVGALLVLPVVVLGILDTANISYPLGFLFSILPFIGVEKASQMTLFFGFLGHLSIIAGLTWKFRKQLRLAGESNTKTLLTPR